MNKNSWQLLNTEEETIESYSYINSTGTTVFTRYNPPQGYTCHTYTDKYFGYHLQNLPLKPYGEKVKYFNGKEKNS